MNKIEHIKQSLRNAEQKRSKLDETASSILGSGLKIKHLLNNLVDFEGCNYLDVGVDKGATLVAALFKNNVNSAYGVKIGIEHNDQILSYKKRFNISFELLNQDYFQLDLSKITNKINVYLYDNYRDEHTYESHYKSLEYFYPILDDEFIFMVNDWVGNLSPYFEEWRQVSDATYDAIEKLNLKILLERHKMKSILEKQEDAWWGGFWISLLKK
jgi:hypothetical protein